MNKGHMGHEMRNIISQWLTNMQFMLLMKLDKRYSPRFALAEKSQLKK